VSRIVLHPDGRPQPVTIDVKPSSGQPGTFDAQVAASASSGRICPTGDGEGRLVGDGRITPYFVHRAGKRIEVWIDGHVYRFAAADSRRARGGRTAARGTSGEVRAPMPGTILKVTVAPGDVVAAGQPLVVLVSMKMEMTLTAPIEGRVASVACRPGQLVDMHAVLVSLEEFADGAATA
jgi:3-methylcrotonyl-CoA carboxylase alpha subunit